MSTDERQKWSKEDLDKTLARLRELEDRIRGLQDRVSAVRDTFAAALSQPTPPPTATEISCEMTSAS